eukprot:2832771-Amphidinium_carterae.1
MIDTRPPQRTCTQSSPDVGSWSINPTKLGAASGRLECMVLVRWDCRPATWPQYRLPVPEVQLFRFLPPIGLWMTFHN